MTAAAVMPAHGGLVPLGLSHSISQFIYIPYKNTTNSACLQGKCCIFFKPEKYKMIAGMWTSCAVIGWRCKGECI